MKIRLGFVSNSSSTSFCIFGLYVGDNVEVEALKLVKDNELRVEYGCSEWDDSVYVGLPPSAMKDDETLSQFRDRVRRQLVEKDPKYQDTHLSWITDGGYNG